MSLHRDRILDRVWLTLSGAAVIAVTLQLGARLGARPWPIDAALAAQAAASVPAVCRDGSQSSVRSAR
ncbi:MULTISPECIES: hypothetical protein [unclassified Methylobacterium]|uniref:hypothetical protein n=1 Tax=unclassified Methylobacterium TaxID=2615210 RepID=UPI0011C1E84E|nr:MULTISPECIES: hypothetical protein [unclassified Methylobacterium]QEE40824.1 hypothetical protein FVA80_19390 [Methylobacterium sp. WL1]TXN00829.1 hypothetical protein FV242_20630 [Methylobacterium sp. WL64]TXN56947.1 hypothetical protein FV241_13480 [Methylobacterium sp. WL2]